MPISIRLGAAIAQPVEHRIRNAGVACSSHAGGTKTLLLAVRPSEQSHQETDEATFAKQLAKELYRRAHSGDFAALVLIADPQTLGQIRPLLHKEVQERLTAELGKTLTKASIPDIQKALDTLSH